ncbi:MAG: outer membrane lipoprotein carrier protein LolA [Bacteroidota bacterium]|nr:outer membrane lipoprotein carrier protein LolA [Bacteroidota bacterium]
MMKILLIGFLTFCASSAFSQNNQLGVSDPDAKVILDNVSAKFKTYKTVTADFTLSITNATGKVEGTKKGIVYMKGSKYRVNISGQQIYSDGDNIWTYDKSANEVQLTKFDPSANTITPQKMFTNFYDKDFLYKLNGEKKEGNKMVQEIELTPVDKTKTFFKVLVNVDKATKNIISSKVFEKNGDRYIYTINLMKPNTNLPDSLFTFDAKKYPNVEVVDLR